MAAPSSDIAGFYKGRNVFITGATGFLAKLLLEKLLRSCPGVGNIYLLLRPKNGFTVQKRLHDIFESPLFCKVKATCPEVMAKVRAMKGDVAEDRLGLSEEDELELVQNVSVVVHAAATVRFDEKLRTALRLNLLGTKRIIDLCHRMGKLAVLVHVSTSYANCERSIIDEVVYPFRCDPIKIMSEVDGLTDEEVEAITPRLLGDMPNTYIFTKALSEVLLSREEGRLPIAIIRPSIVVSTWKDPFPGWIDGQNGPIQLVGGIYEGIVRTWMAENHKILDLVPVDVSINLSLAAGWYVGSRAPGKVEVFHSTTGTLRPVTWGDFQYWVQYHIVRNQVSGAIWLPRATFHTWLWRHWFDDFWYHYLPAICIDFGCALNKQVPMMLRLRRKLHRVIDFLDFFTHREWQFNMNQSLSLWDRLSPHDQELFNFDVRSLDWPTYFSHFVAAIRKYQMQGRPIANRKDRRRMMRRLAYTRFLQGVCQFLIGVPILWCIEKVLVTVFTPFEWFFLSFFWVWFMWAVEPGSFYGHPGIWAEELHGKDGFAY